MPRYYANKVAPKLGPVTVFVDTESGVEMVVTDQFIQTILDTLTGRPVVPAKRAFGAPPIGSSPSPEARAKMSASQKKRWATDQQKKAADALNTVLKQADDEEDETR